VTDQLKVAYAGLTHLGTCHAVAAHQSGFKVTGFDTDCCSRGVARQW